MATTTPAESSPPSVTSCVVAAWPFWVGPLMLLVAEIVGEVGDADLELERVALGPADRLGDLVGTPLLFT